VSNEYMRTYMLNRYHERRAEALALLGGKCAKCGTTDDLQIDHIDPATKTMSISGMWSCSYERYLRELKLCQLLCREHHRKKTAQEQSIPHGGGKTGKKNCMCELCGPLKRQYARERSNSKPRPPCHQHGTPSRYASGCRCDDCREMQRNRMRDYRAQKRAAHKINSVRVVGEMAITPDF
jgi:hypothetical protein